MKTILIISTFFFAACNIQKDKKSIAVINNGQIVSVPDYLRKATGYDSIQLVVGGRAKYNENKQDFDIVYDSVYANFCYPNKYRYNSDTVNLIFWGAGDIPNDSVDDSAAFNAMISAIYRNFSKTGNYKLTIE